MKYIDEIWGLKNLCCEKMLGDITLLWLKEERGLEGYVWEVICDNTLCVAWYKFKISCYAILAYHRYEFGSSNS